MIGLIHRRTRQIVHRGIDDAEVFLLAGLEVLHLGHADPGIAHQRAARFQHEGAVSMAPLVESLQQPGPQCVCRRWCVTLVVDPQAAAKVDVLQGDARLFDGLHQVEHTVQRIQVRPHAGDLRADVAVNADDLQPAQAGRSLVHLNRALVGNAKLVALQAGGNVGMRLCIHVGVDAQTDGGQHANLTSHCVEHLELALALHVEALDARQQGSAHLGAGFAHA